MPSDRCESLLAEATAAVDAALVRLAAPTLEALEESLPGLERAAERLQTLRGELDKSDSRDRDGLSAPVERLRQLSSSLGALLRQAAAFYQARAAHIGCGAIAYAADGSARIAALARPAVVAEN